MVPESGRDRSTRPSKEEIAFRSASIKYIVNALANMLGKGGAQAVLSHLEKDYGIRSEEIPARPMEFVQGVRSIFGSGAAVLISGVSASLKKNMTTSIFLDEFLGALEFTNALERSRPDSSDGSGPSRGAN